MARYLDLPRLRDEHVLVAAIQDGVSRIVWQDEGFAYAESWDETRSRYQGLKCGTSVRVIIDDRTVLVKPEAAAAQIARDREAATAVANPGGGDQGRSTSTSGIDPANPGDETAVDTSETGHVSPPPATPKLTRFHGSAQLDPLRMGRDASRIAEEVIQHLTGLVGGDVEITLEIQARLPDGASDKLVRDVTENCRTLKFNDFGFEED